MATIDILIPTYNGAKVIIPTLKSILSQNYKNFNIIICDDASTDNTVLEIKKIKNYLKIKNSKLKIISNSRNLGYPKNLERGRSYCHSPLLFLMGQDDILAKNCLKTYVNLFKNNPKVGAITRPYFWFNKNIKIPVRAKKQLNPQKNQIVKITDSPHKIISVFDTLDQLSGLAYRQKFMDTPFHPDIFPCHIYPFASIFLKHPVIFLKDYTIAVRIESSQSRHLSSIYNQSPILSWYQMINNIFNSKPKIKKYLIKDFVAKNYIGLLQIKNYSTPQNLVREIYYLVKFRPQNLWSLSFWTFSLFSFFTPPFLLIPLVSWYKKYIYAKTLKHINFDYEF